MDNILKNNILSLPILSMTGEELADVYYQNAIICLNDVSELVNAFEYAINNGSINSDLIGPNNQFAESFSIPMRDNRLEEPYYDLCICNTQSILSAASRVISDGVIGTECTTIPYIDGTEIQYAQLVLLDDVATALHIQLQHYKSMIAISKSITTFKSSETLISNLAAQVQLLDIDTDADIIDSFISAQTSGMAAKDEMVLLAKITSNSTTTSINSFDTVSLLSSALRNGTYTNSTPLGMMGGLVGDSISSILGSVGGFIANVISITMNVLATALGSIIGLVSRAYNYVANPPLLQTVDAASGDGSVYETSIPLRVNISNLRQAFPNFSFDTSNLYHKIRELILPGLRVFLTSDGSDLLIVFRVQPSSNVQGFVSTSSGSSGIEFDYATSADVLIDTIQSFYSNPFDGETYVKADGSTNTGLSNANNAANSICSSTYHGISTALALMYVLDNNEDKTLYDYTVKGNANSNAHMAKKFNDTVTATPLAVMNDLRFVHTSGVQGNVSVVKGTSEDTITFDENISDGSSFYDIVSATDEYGRSALILIALLLSNNVLLRGNIFITRYVNSFPVSSFRFFNTQDTINRAKVGLGAIASAVLVTVGAAAFIKAKALYSTIAATSQAKYIQAIDDYNSGRIDDKVLKARRNSFQRTNNHSVVPIITSLGESDSSLKRIGKLIDPKF